MFKKTDNEIIMAFDKAKTRQDIADLLEISEGSLRYFLFVIRPENMYKSFTIPKRHGGERNICAPIRKWRNLQRKLAYVLTLKYSPKVCAYGFIKNKCILDNAKNHTKKAEILNIDLKDFFTQFHFGRIVGMLISKPYSLGKEAAITISQIACRNGILPQGAPTSPILTNMLCAPLDNQLMRYAKKHGLIYTRYADDITFSSFRKTISGNIVSRTDNRIYLTDTLQNVFSKNNLTINDDKITLKTKKSRQEVTGIVVNRFPNVKREYYKNIRALLHNCLKNGIYHEALKFIDEGYCKNDNIKQIKNDLKKKEQIEEWYKKVLIGKIRFVGQIKGLQSFTYYTLAISANNLFSEDVFDLTYFDQINYIIDNNVFVLQNKDGTKQGSCFYVPGYGLFTAYHTIADEDFYYLFKNDKKLPDISVGLTINEKSSNSNIDYVLFNINIPNTASLSIGKSSDLRIGDTVIIAGFPDYLKGDTITKEECKITGKTELFDAPFYKVSGRIIHGASGGIVLDTNKNVVGIIKGGCPSNDEDSTSLKQGFLPIDLVMSDINKTNIGTV